MNTRNERRFGPKSEWDKDNERERVEAGRIKAAPERSGKPDRGPADRKDTSGGKAAKKTGHRPGEGRERRSVEPGIAGFVSIRCGGCKKITNTCLRNKTTSFICRECKHENPMRHLKSIHLLCPRCGFTGNYRTNRIGTEIQMECLRCSEIIDLRRDARGNYLPEEEFVV